MGEKIWLLLYVFLILFNLALVSFTLTHDDNLSSTSEFSNDTDEYDTKGTGMSISTDGRNIVLTTESQTFQAKPKQKKSIFKGKKTDIIPEMSSVNVSQYFTMAESMDFEGFVKFWETSVCGESAVCLKETKNVSISSPFVCDGCVCDVCIYGDCCVDKGFGGDIFISPMLEYTSCSTPTERLFGNGNKSSYIFVTKCPRTYINNYVKGKCENRPNQLKTILDNPPMYSPKSQMSYLNPACAECHNDVDHLQTWTSEITCTKSLIISKIKSMDELTTLLETKVCHLLFDPPEDSLFRSCKSSEKETINECNVTGDWEEFKEDIHTACGMYTNRMTIDSQRYRNVFCALCNVKLSRILKGFGQLLKSYDQTIPSFSIIFNLRQKPESAENSNCPDDSVLLKKDTCRKLVCSPGRILRFHACEDAFKTVKGLGFRLRFHLLPNGQPNVLKRKHINTFWTEFQTQVVIKHNDDLLKLKVSLFNLTMTVCFEPTVLKNIVSIQDATAELHTVIGGDMSQSQAELTLMKLFGTEWEFNKVVWRVSAEISDENSNSNLKCKRYSASIIDITTKNNHLTNEDLFIPLTPLSRCNQTELSPEEYSLNHTTGQLETNVTDMKYQRGEYIIDGDKVRICINVSQPEAEISSFEATMEKLTAVSMGVSICCLCLTIAICLISNSHQTLPGKITMALVLTLIIAQLLFITSSQAYGIIWSCRLFGMGLHYFWLSVFAWKHVAGYHMYMSFVHPLRKLSRQVVTLTRYTMYSLGVPLVIVICYTSVHLILSNKEHIGYGDDTCFLSGPIDIGVAFALPVSIVIVCNVFFFARVVRAIRKMSEVQKHSNRPNTNHSIIFMKMSVVLGFTWIVGFLANVENNHILWYAFAVLNGGVGVFIFIGQVWNKNLLLRARRWMCLAYQQDSSVTLTSTTAESVYTGIGTKQKSLPSTTDFNPESKDTKQSS